MPALAGTLSLAGALSFSSNQALTQSGTLAASGTLALSGGLTFNVNHNLVQSSGVAMSASLALAGDLVFSETVDISVVQPYITVYFWKRTA